MPQRPVYLDYNATTPVDPAVAATMTPFLSERFGNPGSSHAYGRDTSAAVQEARRQVADLLGCAPAEVVFTSGGSESNNLAIKGTAWAAGDRGGHLVTTAVEHPAVLEVCRWLQGQGFDLTLVPVDGTGRVDPDDVAAALRPDTVLVSVMLANNEVGTLQPVREIAALCRERGVPVHCDAAQAVGKVPVRIDELGVDLLSLAGHKFYGPKGIGALYVRHGTPLVPLVHGASQESGRRAGTENVLEVVGLGEAAALARQDLPAEMERLRTLRDRLERLLADGCPDAVFHGHRTLRLPNTCSVGFPGRDAGELLRRLADRVAVSAGAACHAGGTSVSHVLAAMGVPREAALGTLRISLGRFTTQDEVDAGAEAILEAVAP